MRVPARSEAFPAAADRVEEAVAALPVGAWVLAVSGGRDSMVLLEAFARLRRSEVVEVATFDHGSGAHATAAVGVVRETVSRYGLRVVTGEHRPAAMAKASEATWREARWTFLNRVAWAAHATVVTAHTWDDQAETVFLRTLRASGAWGLGGMRSRVEATDERPPLVRPFLDVRRSEVAAYAARRAIRFLEDPSNADLRHARNRVRLELLPACERARPGFSDWLIDLGRRATAWRARVDRFVDELSASGAFVMSEDRSVVVQVAALDGVDDAGWRVLWPAFAARAGVVLDRRGIERAAGWCARGAPVGSVIQLAGGASIERARHAFVLRPATGTT